MKHRSLGAIVFSALLAWPAALPAAELADADCYVCHKELKTTFAKGTVHEPVADGDCSSCHEEHGQENKLILNAEVPELCWECHDEMKPSHPHEPVAEGDCLDCHDVHSADDSSLLSKKVPDLCGDCHDAEQGKGSTHEPVAEGDCLDCHSTHGSENDSLLTMSPPELCAECHSDTEKSEGNSPHEPVAEGDCTDCHQSHMSDYKTLLTAQYDQNRYAIYEADRYALCFTCHDQKPFETPDAAGTQFRNRQVNLHYLHVYGQDEVNKYGMKKRKEGMTCIGCHLSHGTVQPKLVRANLDCGATYCYTLNYRRFEGGGSCVVGCHKPKVYRNTESGQAPDDSGLQPMAQKAGEAPSEKAP